MEAPKIKYITATLDNSCVPACLAMVTGNTLKKVIADIHEHWEAKGKHEGIEQDVMVQYLSKNGYAIQQVCHEHEPRKKLLAEWPIKPFAPIHIVDVWSTTPAGMHSVVMDKAGRIYDPSNKKIKKLSDYERVFAIVGVWKVTTNLFDIT